MKTASRIFKRFIQFRTAVLSTMGALALLSAPAHAFDSDNDGDDFQFDLIRSTGLNAFPTVAPHAHGKVNGRIRVHSPGRLGIAGQGPKTLRNHGPILCGSHQYVLLGVKPARILGGSGH